MARQTQVQRRQAILNKQAPDSGITAVGNSDGDCLGEVYHTPYGWFANPYGSQIQTIPCDSLREAFETVRRFGVAMEVR